MIYPEGNYIRASEERPFLQIGESKYGKFMLELGVQAEVGLDQAAKIALSSMISTDPAVLNALIDQVPIKRLGRAEEIAQAVLWLCSDASSFVTGQVWPIDGGSLM
mgnify:CR=1 FL=1